MSIRQGNKTIAGGGLGKANTNMDNLTSAGANIANWSSNVTNCITEIPQDIKLELNNGTLTLKAGSKVYVPNGSGVFNELIIQNDLTTITTWGEQVLLGLFVKSDGSTMFIINMEGRCSSGSTPPTATNIQMWYDTTNNLVKRYAGGSDTGDRYSLPIALVQKGDSVESSNISSIDQVFNGFGYIGSTVFALPGVKGLIPDGRNADGTLRNTEFETSGVLTYSRRSKYSDYYIVLQGNEIANTSCTYDERNNYTLNSSGNPINFAIVGKISSSDNDGKISNFLVKTAFHAVDYNDSEYMAHQAMPDYSKAYNIILPASGNIITAPNDGYFDIVLNVSSNGFLRIEDNFYHANSNGGYVGGLVPVKKYQQLFFQYNNMVESIKQQFVPAVGAQ